MLQYFFAFVLLALAMIQSDAFTASTSISLRISSTQRMGKTTRLTSSVRYVPRLGMTAICDVDSSVLADRETNLYKIHQVHHSNSSELSNVFEKWTMQLSNDSSNTRSYVCRCLVEIAGLSEDDSYQKMMQAHEHSEVVIGEYSQEHAEHYKEGLTRSGLVCEIFPVEE